MKNGILFTRFIVNEAGEARRSHFSISVAFSGQPSSIKQYADALTSEKKTFYENPPKIWEDISGSKPVPHQRVPKPLGLSGIRVKLGRCPK